MSNKKLHKLSFDYYYYFFLPICDIGITVTNHEQGCQQAIKRREKRSVSNKASQKVTRAPHPGGTPKEPFDFPLNLTKTMFSNSYAMSRKI